MTDADLSFDLIVASPKMVGIGREMRYRDFIIIRIPSDCGDDYSVLDAFTRDEAARFSSDEFDDAEDLRKWLDDKHDAYWG